MSCPENNIPCGCETNPCGCKISSDDVSYQGPNLECTGIENCDTLTASIQKLNDYACSIDMVQNIITNITNNISLYNQFTTIVNQTVDCDTVFNCLASTTTTTIAPTTTTTTTVAPILVLQLYGLCDGLEAYVLNNPLLYSLPGVYTAVDGKAYAVVNAIPIIGIPNVVISDYTNYNTFANWLAINISCP